MQEQETGREKRIRSPTGAWWKDREALKSQWLAEERCLRDIQGRERLRKSLEVRRVKMNTKHRAVAPKLQPLLYRTISLEKRAETEKDIFSLASVECKEERRQVRKKRNIAWNNASRAEG